MVDRPQLTPVEWIGSAREDLCAFPEAVQDEARYARAREHHAAHYGTREE